MPASHPIVLAVPSDSTELAELDAIASGEKTICATVARVGDRRMRDLKQLRRALRKRHGRDPWVIGVGVIGEGEPELGPRTLLDTLAYAANQPPPPLIFWFAADPQVDAWLALDPRSTPRLAISSALIDISQPRAAQGPIAPLARAAFEAMQAEGLLPAAPGRAPSHDPENSP